jgi:hypothetical protein
VDGGAIAAGVIFGLLGAAALGVFVYARFFGGGPRVAAAWSAVKGAAGKGAAAVTGAFSGGNSKAERASLMRAPAASASSSSGGTTSSAAAAARFAPIGGGY